MNISLTPELEKFVNKKVESGLFQTASEVVRAALRLLCEQDEVRQKKLEELRREIAIGIEQLDRGESAPFNAMEILAEVRAKRAKLKRQKK